MRILCLDLGWNQSSPRANFGLLTIAAAAAQAGHSVTTRQYPFNFTKLEGLLEKTDRPDVVALSCGICNAERTARFIEAAKKERPDTKVVIGGYGPTALGANHFKAADEVVVGPGTTAFIRLLGSTSTDMRSGVPYLALAEDDGIHEIVTGSQLQGIAPLSYERQRVIQFLSEYGCPHQCSFCASSTMHRGVTVRLDPSCVADEVERAVAIFNANCADCLNLTFNSDLDHSLSLCTELAKRRIGERLSWTAMLNPARTKGIAELIPALREAGCFKIGVGLESLTEEGRAGLAKPGRSIESCYRTMSLAQSHGLLVRGYIVIARPEQSDRELEMTWEKLPFLPADEVAISFYTPFPSTADWDRYHHLISDWNYGHWDMHHPIYLGGRSVDDWYGIHKKMSAAFYRGSQWQNRMAGMTRRNPAFKAGYRQFMSGLSLD